MCAQAVSPRGGRSEQWAAVHRADSHKGESLHAAEAQFLLSAELPGA